MALVVCCNYTFLSDRPNEWGSRHHLGWLLDECPDIVGADRVVIMHGMSDRGPGGGHGDLDATLRGDLAARGVSGERAVVFRPATPPYGVHHTKMFLVRYPDGVPGQAPGVRLVISTANMCPGDCERKNQVRGAGLAGPPPRGAPRAARRGPTGCRAVLRPRRGTSCRTSR